MQDLAQAAVLTVALVAMGGYLLGSIPFGVIATRLGGMGDIRQVGSGNIGATNVLRTGRKDLAALTLVGDAGKGALAVFLAWLAFKDARSLLPFVAGGAAFVSFAVASIDVPGGRLVRDLDLDAAAAGVADGLKVPRSSRTALPEVRQLLPATWVDNLLEAVGGR